MGYPGVSNWTIFNTERKANNAAEKIHAARGSGVARYTAAKWGIRKHPDPAVRGVYAVRWPDDAHHGLGGMALAKQQELPADWIAYLKKMEVEGWYDEQLAAVGIASPGR